MPLSASSRPRNMFPPPTTTATWTPSCTTATISLAMRWTTVGEMPSGSSPEKASPDSLTTTRRQGLCSGASPLDAAAAERPLDERDFLEDRAKPALDDLGDRLLGLALVPGDPLRDAAFPRDHVGRDLVAGDIQRAHRRDLLGAGL